MGQIVVDLLHLTAAVYIVSVILRTAAQLLKDRAPSVAHAIEYGIGK
jgi:hypothetical protein